MHWIRNLIRKRTSLSNFIGKSRLLFHFILNSLHINTRKKYYIYFTINTVYIYIYIFSQIAAGWYPATPHGPGGVSHHR